MELQKEMTNKEEEAYRIDQKIADSKKLLSQLRYTIISDYYYYNCDSKILQQHVTNNGSDQKSIHPSLKKLIGKKPLNFEDILLDRRTKRKSTQEEPTNFSKRTYRQNSECDTSRRGQPLVTLRNKSSEVYKLTSSRGKDQIKYTLVVGNTSQYCEHITEEPVTSKITHKWMCYLKSSVPIEKLVKKVRFYLDPSYKPNDIFEISTQPFQLTRRGYGEFPIKLLIFFNDCLNMKPIQIFHQLVFDQKFSGHQSLGNETVSEFYAKNIFQGISNQCQDFKKYDELTDHNYCKIFGQELTRRKKLNRERADVVEWINNFLITNRS